MPDSFTCLYCNSVMPIIGSTTSYRYPSFEMNNEMDSAAYFNDSYNESTLCLTFYKCPRCGRL